MKVHAMFMVGGIARFGMCIPVLGADTR